MAARKVDADVIPNKEIVDIIYYSEIHQPKTYNFYTNNIGFNGVTCYDPISIELIFKDIDRLSELRPESSALRLPRVNKRLHQMPNVVGLHGFFQSDEDMARVRQHTLARKHIFDDKFLNNIKEIQSI